MKIDIDELKAKSARCRPRSMPTATASTLFDPQRLDPDIVTERARALLIMAQSDDIIVMVDPETGEPISSSFDELAADRVNRHYRRRYRLIAPFLRADVHWR